MPVDFRRHLVGKTMRNVCHRDSAQKRFVGKSVIVDGCELAVLASSATGLGDSLLSMCRSRDTNTSI